MFCIIMMDMIHQYSRYCIFPTLTHVYGYIVIHCSYMYFCFRCNNDNAVLPAKGDSQFANEVEATTLQPKQINRKPVMPDKADKGLKLNNVTTRNRKTDGASSTKEQGMSKSVGLQVEKVTFKSPHSQTKQVKFKNAASQTKENQTTEDMGK